MMHVSKRYKSLMFHLHSSRNFTESDRTEYINDEAK